MRIIYILFLVCLTLMLSSCYNAENSTVKANDVIPRLEIQNQSSEDKATDDKLEKVQTKSQLVWFGEVSSDDINSQDKKVQIKNYVMLTNSPLDKIGIEIEVDVLNCGGYLFSATASKYKVEGFNEEDWKLNVHSETIATDAIEKIKLCNFSKREKEDESFFSRTWAVAPQDKKRQNIKTQIDSDKVFLSLPKNVKDWLDQKIVSKPDECCERKMKGVVSVLEDDSWVDLDSDGNIDWLRVSGINKENLEIKGQNFTDVRFYQRKKNEWKEIKTLQEKD
jgi:hypothetical protein